MKVKVIPTPKKKNFLKLPSYTGGKKAFMNFVAENMVYPKEANAIGIEGIVHTEYEVDNHGKISDIRIKKGIGYGCDEEAIRILSLMVYEPVNNRGLRIKSKMKARILFKLPLSSIEKTGNSLNFNYSITPKKDQEKKDQPTFSYTINLD
jgi:TonB family protein